MSEPIPQAAGMSGADTQLPVAELFVFLEELRGEYAFGLDEFLAVQSLLVELARRGALPDDPAALEPYLSPILCSTALEQADFPARYRAFLTGLDRGRRSPTPAPRFVGPTLREFERALKRGRWVRLLTGSAIALLLAVALWWVWPTSVIEPWEASVENGRVELPEVVLSEPAPAREGSPWPLLLLAAMGVLGAWSAYWWWQGRRFARRRNAAGELAGVIGFGDAPAPPLGGGMTAIQAARYLRQRQRASSQYLDLTASVQATIRKGNRAELVHRHYTEVPEYLCLVDRRSAQDLAAASADHLLDLLRREGVHTRVHAFDGDPRLVFPADRRPEPRTLRELAADHQNHRLLIFGESRSLVDAWTGRPGRLTEELKVFRSAALLTPEPTSSFGPRERALSREGVSVLPATPEGLAATRAQAVARGLSAAADGAALSPLFPQTLEHDARMWLHDEPPPHAIVEAGLAEVFRYLGQGGGLWLAACAVYPQVNRRLTLELGRHLEDDEGVPVLQATTLARLSRLPWMREGYMPDWLRRRLLQGLPRDTAARLRTLVQSLVMAGEDAQDAPAATLEIHTGERRALQSLWRRFARQRRAQGDADAAFRDRVFMDFTNDALGLRLPALVARRLVRGADGKRRLVPPATYRVLAGAWLLSCLLWGGLELLDDFVDAGAATLIIAASLLPMLRHFGNPADGAARRRAFLSAMLPPFGLVGLLVVDDLTDDATVLFTMAALGCTWAVLLTGGGFLAGIVLDRTLPTARRVVAAGAALLLSPALIWGYLLERLVRWLGRLRPFAFVVWLLDALMPDRYLLGSERRYHPDAARLRATLPAAIGLGVLSVGTAGLLLIPALPFRYAAHGRLRATARAWLEGLACGLGFLAVSAAAEGFEITEHMPLAFLGWFYLALIPAVPLLSLLATARPALSEAVRRHVVDRLSPERVWRIGPRGLLLAIGAPLWLLVLAFALPLLEQLAPPEPLEEVMEPPPLWEEPPKTPLEWGGRALEATGAVETQSEYAGADRDEGGAQQPATEEEPGPHSEPPAAAPPRGSTRLPPGSLPTRESELKTKLFAKVRGELETLTAAQISQAVASQRATLAPCRRHLATAAKPSAMLQITVAASGGVERVEFAGAADALGHCLSKAALQWRFPAASKPTVVSVPVRFEDPAGGDPLRDVESAGDDPIQGAAEE